MNNNFFTFFISSIFLIVSNISPSVCTYKDCSAVFNCGEILGVGFPFWGEHRPPNCGVPELKLTCNNNVAMIDIMQVKYRVLQVDGSTKTLRIARDDYFDGVCPITHLKNTSLDPNLLEISNGYVNITLVYGCDSSLLVVPAQLRFGCPIHGDGFLKLREEILGPWNCKDSVVVPVRGDEGILVGVLKMEEAIREGFEVKWKVDVGACGGDCVDSGGVCGYDLKLRRGICFCETGFSSPSPVEVCRRDGGAAIHHASAANPAPAAISSTAATSPTSASHSGATEGLPAAAIRPIARADYMGTLCPKKFINTTIDYNLFDIIPTYRNITLLYCSSSPLAGQFNCPGYEFGFIEGSPIGPSLCNVSVIVPVSLNFFPPVSDIVNATEMSMAIDEGFEVSLKDDGGGCGICKQSEGVCGYDLSSNRTTCYCRAGDSIDNGACRRLPAGGGPASSPGGNGSKNTSLIIGLSIGGVTVLGLCLGCFAFYITQRRKKHVMKLKSKDLSSPPSSGGILTPSTFRSNSIPSYPYSRSNLENGSSYFGAQIFTYAELVEATHNFDRSRELGDGGYGTVYSGTLRDGRIVAVKRLYENNYKRVEQFTNEVEILSKLQHPNLVKLYGCTSRHSRELLLVYEYIPNGTVADHLHGKQANSGLLSWSVRLKIAIETANALAYLHRNDIIHRDVKTNNILLDNNFKVKVADFGLSRLFPLDVTHVSTAPQGTPGYVDPEYYQCYQLTDKSDVYSFGVVLVELISSLQAVDINRNRNDINLSNMAIDRIQNHALADLVDLDLGFDRDYAVRCMIKSVAELAYRCLQQTRDVRPSMDEVLEILKELENEELTARKAEVLDIGSDNVRLLRNTSSLLSPDSAPVTDKWVKVLNRTT